MTRLELTQLIYGLFIGALWLSIGLFVFIVTTSS